MEDHKRNILEIRGAYKRYSPTTIILRGLNMTVPRGTIYGLLGPSGCGKTSLLSCVAGYRTLDSGSIRLGISEKSELGFMPQDIALQELFTVSEMFTYFGRVFGLPSSTITSRGQELLYLMELPPEKFWDRVIRDMSGGQQRRVSLAVTILHDPALMILDEPTVGLDPLLSEKLWEYFLEITEQYDKTIIITTHYIEETRRAHTIGLMRSGILLAEASPSQLLVQYRCEALEDVFLLLSKKQNVVCVENEEDYPKRTPVDIPLRGDSKLWDLNRLGAEIYRNSCQARRNIPMMLFMIGLPAFIIFIFCIMCSDNLNSVVISVISEDVLPDSCLHPVQPHQDLPLCKPQSLLSCRYLQYIEDKNYIVEEHADFDSAYQSVQNGHAHAVLHFERNYSWAFIRRLSEFLYTPDRHVNNSIIKVHMDRSDITTAHRIEEDLRDGVWELAKSVAIDCDYNPKVTDSVVDFETPVFGELDSKFTDSAFPGILIPFAFYITEFLSATAISSQRASGFLDRCLLSGVRQTELIFAQALVQVLLIIGQNVLLFTLAYGIYNMPLRGSWGLAISLLGVAQLEGMFYGFLLAAIIETETNVSYASTGTVLFLFSTCGLLWPLEGAHWAIQKLIYYFPVLMAVQSYRSVTIRGWTLMNKYIGLTIFANICFIVFLVTMFIVVSRVKNR